MDFKKYIPHRAYYYITQWINELNIDVQFVNSRKTKLGDYRFRNNQHFITVNNNLNKYAALITLTHEIAHAFTFAEFGKTIKPHGIQWKENFKKLMLTFFDYNIFPDEGLTNPDTIFNIVVLPHPDGPRIAYLFPSSFFLHC